MLPSDAGGWKCLDAGGWKCLKVRFKTVELALGKKLAKEWRFPTPSTEASWPSVCRWLPNTSSPRRWRKPSSASGEHIRTYWEAICDGGALTPVDRAYLWVGSSSSRSLFMAPLRKSDQLVKSNRLNSSALCRRRLDGSRALAGYRNDTVYLRISRYPSPLFGRSCGFSSHGPHTASRSQPLLLYLG